MRLKPYPHPFLVQGTTDEQDSNIFITGISNLCHRLQPDFEMSRLCVKVPSTWEGLQACRKLSVLGIGTLATTLFTMEQAILAAEAKCVCISPFVHELKAFFDDT